MDFKYKVGQAVRVRFDLQDGGKEYFMRSGPAANKEIECATWDMCGFAGKIVHISAHTGSVYRVKEDPENWRWSDDMFFGPAADGTSFTSLL